MPEHYDVFLSYARADLPGVELLEAALRARGLRVWRDERDIDNFTSITGAIELGVARSKALVAYYSSIYPTRRACQFELTSAFVAAQREGDPRQRVLVVNPEAESSHIQPVELRDELYQHAPLDEPAASGVARAIDRHVARLNGSIGDIDLRERPQWFGTQPTGSTRFVGRLQAMWEVHSAVQGVEYGPITGTATAGAAQIRGLAGMGKTLVAEEYALRFGAAYPGGVYWLYALGTAMSDRSREERDGLRYRQVEAFTRTLLPGKVATHMSPEEIEGLFRLEIDRRGLPYLWVVDDFPTGASASELRSWLAPHPLGRSLLTTRSRDYAALATPVELEPLPELDGYHLLTASREPLGEAEVGAARLIVSALGGSALALDVAGATLAAAVSTKAFSDFHRSLSDESSDVLDLAAELSGELPTGHERSIAATINSTLARLSELANDLMRIASQLASAPIPLRLAVEAVARTDDLDFGALSVDAAQALDELRGHSLVDHAEGAADAEFVVHTLVARAVRFRERNAPRLASLRFAAVRAMIEVFNQVEDLDAQPVLSRWAVHGQQLTSAAANRYEFELLGLLAHLDYERADYAAAEVAARKTYLGFAQYLGEDDPETQAAKGDLGAALYANWKLTEAAEIQQAVLARALNGLGESEPSVLIARANLAATLGRLGDLEGGRLQHEIVYAERSRSLGPEHPDTLSALSNLASCASERGDYREARRLAGQSFETCLRTLGANHAQTLHAQQALTHATFSLGDYKTARKMQEALLEALTRLRGPTHDDTLLARTNLAATLAQLGDAEGARSHEEAAYNACCEAFGEAHSQTLWIGGNLAMTLSELGEQEAALALLTRVVDGSRHLHGENHPDTIVASTNLGELTELAGMPEEALAIKEKSFAAAEIYFGPHHPNTLRIRLSFANTLLGVGQLAIAGDHFQAAANELNVALGLEHPDTLRATANLATVLFRQGHIADAVALEESVLDVLDRVFGPNHPLFEDVARNHQKSVSALDERGAVGERELTEARVKWQRWRSDTATES